MYIKGMYTCEHSVHSIPLYASAWFVCISYSEVKILFTEADDKCSILYGWLYFITVHVFLRLIIFLVTTYPLPDFSARCTILVDTIGYSSI